MQDQQPAFSNALDRMNTAGLQQLLFEFRRAVGALPRDGSERHLVLRVQLTDSIRLIEQELSQRRLR